MGSRKKDSKKICLIINALIVNLAGYRNKRTNGPVNAHLISGPSINTKHTIPDKNGWVNCELNYS